MTKGKKLKKNWFLHQVCRIMKIKFRKCLKKSKGYHQSWLKWKKEGMSINLVRMEETKTPSSLEDLLIHNRFYKGMGEIMMIRRFNLHFKTTCLMGFKRNKLILKKQIMKCIFYKGSHCTHNDYEYSVVLN